MAQPMDLFIIFDLVIVGGAIYFIYAALMLKFKNQVSTSLMLPKEFAHTKCRDIDNYKRYMSSRTLICGIILLISGLASCAGELYPEFNAASRWFFIPGFLSLVWFMYASKKALERYFK